MEKHTQPAQKLRVLIAGGGTGGHVFPAIAIAHAIKERAANAHILFVGAKGRMEMRKVPQAGFRIIGLDIAGLQRRLTWKNLLLPWKLLKSMTGAKRIVKRFRPDVVIGVGGYASGPVVWAAAGQKQPVLIQEQNSYPGITNRILGKKADKICVAYEGMEAFFAKEKVYITGNPVRQQVVDIAGKREEALRYFGLTNNKPVLLVTGGSGGARSINEGVAHNLQRFKENGIQLIWQTGAFYFDAARDSAKTAGEDHLYINAFIDRMDYAYAAADVVVSRAGAIAVSEISSVKKPAIFIPSPNVAEDHQTKNAQALVNHNAAILLKDHEVKDRLANEVSALIFDDNKKQRFKEKLAGLSFLNAADVIAGIALDLASKKHSSARKSHKTNGIKTPGK
ncbi:MAG: undecaprenyldiphospho-muramoylpentapeptide beta-N-acetylglucosaminyltransferase [Bacteroidales bacterium]